MIVERHYDDETLIGLLATRNGEALRDPHLAVCTSCSEMLASYRAIAEVLGDDAVWDLRDLRDERAPETISNLRSLASAAASDEAAAAGEVARLLEQPESSWRETVTRRLELQTPAAVSAAPGSVGRACNEARAGTAPLVRATLSWRLGARVEGISACLMSTSLSPRHRIDPGLLIQSI